MHDDQLLQAMLAIPSVEEAKISPDRRWVAFAWYRVSSQIDIFVAPTDGSAPPTQLTATPDETQLIAWAPDSQSVIVAEDHEGDEHVRLFRVELSHPGEMIPLTEDHPPYFLRGGQLSPDQHTLYYSMNYDVARGETTEGSLLYRHDPASDERTVIARSRRASWLAPELNSAGTHLLQARIDRHPGGEQVHLIDVEGGSDVEILNAGAERKVRAAWMPDGRNVLFVAEHADGSYQRVGCYDIVTAASDWLIDDPQMQIEAVWPTRDGLIVVDEVRDARHYAHIIDPQTGERHPFAPLSGNLQPLGRAHDGAWITLHYSSTAPVDLLRIESDNRAVSLTRVRERMQIDPTELTPAEDFRWHSVDGLEIQGWLYRAAAPCDRAVLYIHGGPTWHSEDWINPQIQFLVRRGFHVLDVNYRGSTGFGLEYRETIKIDGWGGREQADIRAGAEALIAAGIAAPGKIGITGTSYGGYSSWCQIVHTPPEVIAAAAPICGMTDLVIDYETTRPDLRPYSEEMIGGRPDEIPDRYRERSPIHFVEQIRGKLLIIQGSQDPNVTPENVRQVRTRLDAAGIPYELLEFADEGHGIHRLNNQATLYRHLAQFFEEALS